MHSELQVSYIVNRIFTSRTYILSKENRNEVWLVDCGDFDEILKRIGSRLIIGVLLTHAHFDHIYGLPELLSRFPESRIYTDMDGRDTLADSKRNLSLYHEAPVRIQGPQVCICEEGGEISLFQDVSARVFATPGHHPSCLSFAVDDYLFTGDSFIPGNKVVTNLPGGDGMMAKQSLDRILKIAEGKTILPGHQV